MTIESHTPSLELCKELKENGYPQESLFYWVHDSSWWGKENEWKIFNSGHVLTNDFTVGKDCGIAAPLASEIGEQLPEHVLIKRQLFRMMIDVDSNKRFYINYIPYEAGGRSECDLAVFEHDAHFFGIHKDNFGIIGLHTGGSKSLAESLAGMWLYLKKNNLLPQGEKE